MNPDVALMNPNPFALSLSKGSRGPNPVRPEVSKGEHPIVLSLSKDRPEVSTGPQRTTP